MAKAKKVSIDKFAEEIRSILNEYGDYIDQTVVKNAIHSTAEETAAAISDAAPRRKGAKGGAYAEAVTSGYPTKKGRTYTETVYVQSPHYRLAHLLERPHATRNGGRTRAFPHWQPGMDGVIGRIVKHIKEALK